MAFNSRDFRTALGTFTTGVCVVACRPAGADPVGITVNSFTSVSLEPPLILWCIDKASDRFEAFTTADRFSVNILAEQHRALSVSFAGDGIWDGVAHTLTEDGLPLVSGALAVLVCRGHAAHDAGDHVILVGEVQDLSVSPDAEPLIYHSGQYRGLHPDGH